MENENMLGLEATWECPACGMLIKNQSPFWNKKFMKLVEEPGKCGCGRKAGFRLVGFKECQFEVIKEE